MEDWFRWVIGGLIGLYTAVTGWLAHLVLSIRDKHASLDKRMAVMEVRPHIDPVVNMKVLTELTLAVTNLTTRLSESNQVRNEQYNELKNMIAEIYKEIEVLAREVKNRQGGLAR